MNATGNPTHWFRLYVLADVTSQALMDEKTLVCPICGAPALRTYLRAGLADFVTALLCLPCRAIWRAVDTFSLAGDVSRQGNTPWRSSTDSPSMR
jgi:formate dehydrogenase maturation protein FdhE